MSTYLTVRRCTALWPGWCAARPEANGVQSGSISSTASQLPGLCAATCYIPAGPSPLGMWVATTRSREQQRVCGLKKEDTGLTTFDGKRRLRIPGSEKKREQLLHTQEQATKRNPASAGFFFCLPGQRRFLAAGLAGMLLCAGSAGLLFSRELRQVLQHRRQQARGGNCLALRIAKLIGECQVCEAMDERPVRQQVAVGIF